MGLNLNRYRLAQQVPENEAKSLAINPKDVQQFNLSNIKENMAKLQNGLYFIGLDNHVGYLYLYQNHSFFIHSNYIEGKVMIENTEHSKAFNSNYYYLTPITANDQLMKKWLMKESISIFTN